MEELSNDMGDLEGVGMEALRVVGTGAKAQGGRAACGQGTAG